MSSQDSNIYQGQGSNFFFRSVLYQGGPEEKDRCLGLGKCCMNEGIAQSSDIADEI